jgi:RNA polymerase sigma-70 factor (ECF subfamily)
VRLRECPQTFNNSCGILEFYLLSFTGLKSLDRAAWTGRLASTHWRDRRTDKSLMNDVATEFETLMARARAGSREAVDELYRLYGDHVRRIVRRRLHQRLRTQYDSIDFAQAAWASFVAVPAQRYDFQTPEDLVSFLCSIASNKVIEAYRQRLRSKKRDASRERPLNETKDQAALGRDPTPSQVVMADERWNQLVEGLPDTLRQALDLLRRGHTHQEIAERLGVHPKALQRLLRRLAPRGKQ